MKHIRVSNLITFLFTDFYKTLLYDIDTLNDIYNNTESIPTKCILLGQRMGYRIVANLIEEINGCKDETI